MKKLFRNKSLQQKVYPLSLTGLMACLCLGLLLYANNSFAQPPVGRVLSSSTDTNVIIRSSGSRIPARRRSDVVVGDTLETGSGQFLIMRMLDSSQINLACETQLTIRRYPQGQQSSEITLELLQGNIRIIDGKVRQQFFTVITPVATLEQQRATFAVIQESPTVFLFGVFAGMIRLTSPQGEVIQDAAAEPRFISFPLGGMPEILTQAEYVSRSNAACTTTNNQE